MNQQNQGSGSPSSVPMKRKRGRPRKGESVVQGRNMLLMPPPRKEESVVQGENMLVMPGSDNVLNSNQPAGATNDCDDEMVGKAVTGVIEGTFNSGYLLNVKVAGTDDYLRGLVFLPGQVAPVTSENDVAPHVQMIKRKEVPIPVLNPQTEIHGSVPSSVQCSKQPFQPESEVPMSSKEKVQPTEIHSGISVSLENQPASTMLPMADLSKNETSISSGGIPQGVSEPRHESQSASIMSELECDKAVERDETLHELDTSTQVKESSADGGATKDSPMLPMADLSRNETSISSGGIPQGVSEPGHESQSASIMSELECDKAVERDETLHELGTSTQVKEPSADGGATKDSLPTSEPINIVPTFENTDKELRTGQKGVPSEHKLNELIQDEPNTSNIELNQIPVTAEPQSMPSEQISKSVDNFVEKQASPKIDVLEDTKTELAIETLNKVDNSNSNGRPSTDTANILDVGSSHALETIQPQSIPDEQISKSVPSESKFSSEGCDIQEKSDSQNCSTFDALNKVDVNQPSESLVNPMESENQIGSDIS